jgi:hypothetical protein
LDGQESRRPAAKALNGDVCQDVFPTQPKLLLERVLGSSQIIGEEGLQTDVAVDEGEPVRIAELTGERDRL